MIALPGQVMSIRGPIRGYWDTEYLAKGYRDTRYLRKKIKGICKIDIPGCKLEF